MERTMQFIIRLFAIICLLILAMVNRPNIGICAGWTQIGSDIDGEATFDMSGWSVSLSADGTTVAIGAILNSASDVFTGHVRVYQNISGSWTQIGSDIDGEAFGDESGWSVSLSADGNTVAIGAKDNDGNGDRAGHVRVYRNISGTWTQVGLDIDGETIDDMSGLSVSLSADGTIVAIGAPYNNGSGHVRVYQNISGIWTQIGSDIDGEAANDGSGSSVSLSADGTIVAIGAPWNNGKEFGAGHVRVYQNISSTWTQIGSDIDGEAAGELSGLSVSLSADGTTVAIGAPSNNSSGADVGLVRVYQNITGNWTKIGTDIKGDAADEMSGSSVSLSTDGKTVAIGAPCKNCFNSDAGHVRVYQDISGTWTQIGLDIDGEAADDWSGESVSLSADGKIVAIGAPYNDGSSAGAGHVRVFKRNIFPWPIFMPAISGNSQY